jgi:hypothetical protein
MKLYIFAALLLTTIVLAQNRAQPTFFSASPIDADKSYSFGYFHIVVNSSACTSWAKRQSEIDLRNNFGFYNVYDPSDPIIAYPGDAPIDVLIKDMVMTTNVSTNVTEEFIAAAVQNFTIGVFSGQIKVNLFTAPNDNSCATMPWCPPSTFPVGPQVAVPLTLYALSETVLNTSAVEFFDLTFTVQNVLFRITHSSTGLNLSESSVCGPYPGKTPLPSIFYNNSSLNISNVIQNEVLSDGSYVRIISPFYVFTYDSSGCRASLTMETVVLYQTPSQNASLTWSALQNATAPMPQTTEVYLFAAYNPDLRELAAFLGKNTTYFAVFYQNATKAPSPASREVSPGLFATPAANVTLPPADALGGWVLSAVGYCDARVVHRTAQALNSAKLAALRSWTGSVACWPPVQPAALSSASNDLPAWAIAFIVIGSVAFLSVIAAAVAYSCQRMRRTPTKAAYHVLGTKLSL